MAGNRQTNRPWTHRGADTPSNPRVDSEAGETLIEALMSVALTGIMVVAVLGGLLAAIEASAVQRRAATNEVAARNFAEALTDAPYVACATTTDYAEPPSLEPDSVDGFTVTITSVGGWDKDSDPATFGAFAHEAGAANSEALTDACSQADLDTGLQEITYTVESDKGGQARSHTLLKRYNGTTYDLDEEVPGGGVRCTITADRDTAVDKAAPNTVKGSEQTMDLVGTPGTERQALIHFDLAPGSGVCADENPANVTTVPAGMKIVSATLRLYTWQVSGAPDCATQCNHVLNRITGPFLPAGATSWSEGDTNWANKPGRDVTPTASFSHGSGTGDHTPRTQTITSPRLNTEVGLFYAAASLNHGWSIRQDCGSMGRDCTSPAPGFRMRTREWSEVSQRPTLTVVFAPDDVPGRQLRNVAYDTCASTDVAEDVRPDDVRYKVNAQTAVRMKTCAGSINQLWVHDKYGGTDGQFRLSITDSCFETWNSPNSGAGLVMGGCNKDQAWKRWERVGLTIRYKNTTPVGTMCMTAMGPGYNAAVQIKECNGSDEQKWLFEPPAPRTAKPDVRLTSLGVDPNADPQGPPGRAVPNGRCADLDVGNAGRPNNGISWAQTFPCLGETALGQIWNPAADGRFVDRLNLGYCLSYYMKDGLPIAASERCHVVDEQVWIVQGDQIRNMKLDACLTSNGGRQWLTLKTCNPDPVAAGQAWRLDPATSPQLADLVQVRNTKFGNCMDPDGRTGTQPVKARGCGDSGREWQEFIVLDTNELAMRSEPGMCLQSNGTTIGAALQVKKCVLPDGQNQVPNNPEQQWTRTDSGQLQRKGTTRCAEGFGGLQDVRLQVCLDPTDVNVSAQQWNLEPKGTTTTPRVQMRNNATFSCVDMPQERDATAWPCSGPGRAVQGVLVGQVGDDYEIRMASNPALCLDVQNGGRDNAPVRAIVCNRGDYQRWTKSANGQLKTKSPQGRCLQGAQDNAQLVMKNCLSIDDQFWTFEASYDNRELVQIRNVAKLDCLGLNGTPSSGAVLRGDGCNAQTFPNQVFVELNNGAYAVGSPAVNSSGANWCIDGGNQDGRALILWPCKNPVQDHAWMPTDAGQFRHVATGRCAEYEPDNLVAVTRSCASAEAKPNQQWMVEPVGSSGVSQPIQIRSGNPAGDRVAGCLDVDGVTRTGFSDNAGISILPCLGPNRTNQSFRLASDGHIRSSSTAGQCLDAASTGVDQYRPVLYGCRNTADQYWRLDAGRLMNISRSGAQRRCLQGGLDGMPATMVNCSSDPDQQWVVEDIGTTLRLGAVGQLSLTQNSPAEDIRCMDANQPTGTSPVVGSRCSTPTLGQRFVRLNSGQYRPVAQLGMCLDANSGVAGATLRTQPCALPTDAGAGVLQRWNLDSATGWFNSTTTCVEAQSLLGLAVRQQPCLNPPVPRQQWLFVAEPTVPGGL